MIGTTVGSYRITAKVSIGGMGTVYRAEHTLIGKHAAVKVLHPELRNNRDVVQRFFNEAKATTQIKHPGIVEVFDFGYLPTGDGFIVMEFLDGMSLARRLKKVTKMHEGEAAVLMRSVCSALAAAHAKDIVHRDLKPDNIFLCPDPDAPTGERPKILDFGIAKLNVGLTGPGNATKTGAVMGTPTYMSPEQCRGTGEVDHRADLYSIGCMFYEMVAGRPPFTDLGAGELIGAHLYIEPVKPSTTGATVSPAAEQLIMSLLDKKPEKRPQTAVELGRRFSELAHGHGLVSRVTPPPLHTLDFKPEVEDLRVTTPRKSEPGDEIAPTALSTPGTGSVSAPGSKPSLPGKPELGTDVTIASQPTTLSGAASQSVMRNRGSRLPIYIGIAAAVMVAGGATMFALKGSSKSASPAAQPTPPAASATSKPEPVTPAPAPTPAASPLAPTPTPETTADTAKPTTAKPTAAADTAKPTAAADTARPTAAADTARPTAAADNAKPTAAADNAKPTGEVAKPATTKPATTKPATTKPATTVTTAKPATTKPATTKPATTKPATTKPATTKPATTKPATTKPTTTKPGDKKNGTGSGSGILIETDI